MKGMLLAVTVAVVCSGGIAQAAPPKAGREPTVITLRPSAEPRPALKYRLVPERRSLVAGNAALFYHRAVQLVIEQRARSVAQAKKEGGRPESVYEQIGKWLEGPLAKLPKDEARAQLALHQSVLNEVELGAMRSFCDWEFDRRTEGIALLLPEIQEMRSVARLVVLRAKLAVLDGKTDEAMHWIETGFVVGRHVGDGPILIQALVGLAINMEMARCLEELIQAPGTPSLYWALADRPRPFIDMRHPMEGERYLLEKELPELKWLDQGTWSLDQAHRMADELQRKLFSLANGVPVSGDGTNEMQSFGRRLGVAALAFKVYPEAKAALIAQGRPAAEVEAMPVTQVALLYTMQEYERIRDDGYKWMNVPYWQAYNHVEGSIVAGLNPKLKNPLLTLFLTLIPSLKQARLAAARLDRYLDALQCVEAIRLYAAAHERKLPPSLDALTDSPAPIDLLTGKPFTYTLDGDKATLVVPVPPGGPDPLSYALRYTLELAH